MGHVPNVLVAIAKARPGQMSYAFPASAGRNTSRAAMLKLIEGKGYRGDYTNAFTSLHPGFEWNSGQGIVTRAGHINRRRRP